MLAKYAYVYIDCTHLLETGQVKIAVATTKNGLYDIQAHIADSDNLFHLRLFRIKPDEPIEELIAYTQRDNQYLQYCKNLASMLKVAREEKYLRETYTKDKRGRLDNE